MADYIKRDDALAKKMLLLPDKLAVVEAPTVEAEPVRHGQWLQEHGIYRCSECGAVAPYDVQGDIIAYWPDLRYCHRCGAKMDEEEKQ